MVTSNPCSEAYPGSAAFEAVETKLIADFIAGLQETRDVRAFIDVHSYGQLCKRLTAAVFAPTKSDDSIFHSHVPLLLLMFRLSRRR